MSTALQIPTSHDESEILDRLTPLSNADLRSRLAESLTRSVDELREAAACARLLEERGEDLSHLPGRLLNYLRLIAHGQLQPEVVVHFAGSPTLMRTIAGLPKPDQKRLADGGKVELAVRRGTTFDTRLVSPLDMGKDQFRQVFAGSRIRSVPEQIAHFEMAPPATETETPQASNRRPARVEADAKNATVRVGRTTVGVKEVLGALGGLAPIDHDAEGPGGTVTIDPDIFGPLKRIAASADQTPRHLVRLALLRTYFNGDSPDV